MKNTPLVSLRRFVLALGMAAAFCAYAAPAVNGTWMPSIYTVPHELDCLLKAGHVQGACCSGKAIYLSHQLGICKIGWDGKLIRSIEAPAHLGDTAYADGKIYGAFVIRSKAVRKDGKKGLVRVWDEDLNLLREAWFDEALDGITVIGDTVYVGVDRWGHDKHDGCCIKRLTTDLADLGNVDLDLGYQIHYGVQTMATDGKDLFLGCYGGTSRVSKDLKTVTKVKLACAEGFDLVPKSISKCDTPVFFVVKALGGNMHGWRKDPTNNPPRIRIDFHAYSNGTFVAKSEDLQANPVPAIGQNAEDQKAFDPAKKGPRVLFVGNSITLHSPRPQIGWTSNWGMAASARDKDYVHLLQKKIAAVRPDAQCCLLQVAKTFERAFFKKDWSCERNFKWAREFKPDVIVFFFGANVPKTYNAGTMSPAPARTFGEALDAFRTYLDPEGQALVLISQGFYIRPKLDAEKKALAKKHGDVFVNMEDIRARKDAHGRFNHPGDLGMELIAERFWQHIEKRIRDVQE